MKLKVLFIFLISLNFYCSEQISYIKESYVYDIIEQNDSIYISTAENGVFAFDPDSSSEITQIARIKKFPFRSILFHHDTLLALSYYNGLFYVQGNSLYPYAKGAVPGWSMCRDSSGNIWIAGSWGVYKVYADTVIRFKDIFDAHDIAIFGTDAYIATSKGIKVYDTRSGDSTGIYYPDINFWRIISCRDELFACGKNLCVIFQQGRQRVIRFGPKTNIAWDIVQDSMQQFYIATEKGLFFSGRNDAKARCIDMPGKCIKSVFIDSRGRLWAGKYY